MERMAESAIYVRRATHADNGVIATFQKAMAWEIESRTLDYDLLLQGINEVIASDAKGFQLVAEIDSRVVGSLMVTYEWSDWDNRSYWWIQSVYVDQAWRRRGVYRGMYQFLYNTAKDLGNVAGIRLYVHRANHGAQRTYQELGMSKSHYEMYEVAFPR